MVHFSSFFYKKLEEANIEGIVHWRSNKVKVTSATKLMFPVHVNGDHWCLGVIMTKDEKIIFYDPSGCKRNRVPKFFDTVRIYLKAKAEDEGYDVSTVDKWREEFICHPHQPNNNSCGVYVCMMAQTFCDRIDFEFTKITANQSLNVLLAV